MSATLSKEIQTAQQRGSEATRQLREIVGIDDLKILSIALAEIAVDEAKHNSAFARRVQVRCHEIAELKVPKTRVKSPQADVDLVPIKQIDNHRIDPYAPIDPYFLHEVYGMAQLPLALGRYSLATLKDVAAKIEIEHPGTKPKNKGKKDDVVSYIIEQVINKR